MITATVLEAALEEEMTDHLGHPKHQGPEGGAENIRNGTRAKTVFTDAAGEVTIEVPRDRAGTFAPGDRGQAAAAPERCGRGRDLAVRQGPDHRRDLRALRGGVRRLDREGHDLPDHRQGCGGDAGLDVPAAAGGVRGRCSSTRSIALVRDGQVGNQPFYAAIGVDLNGRRDVLGLWAGHGGGESAKFWLAVLTDLKNRGVRDIFFLVCDGLKGLPDSVAAVFPATIVQACVIHLIRATFRYASGKYCDQLAKDMRAIYTAATADAAWAAFEELEEKSGKAYPAIGRLWPAAWEDFTPFLAYDVEIRRVLFSTNAIESLNSRYRRAAFPWCLAT